MAVAPEGETPALGHHVNTPLMSRRKDRMQRNLAGDDNSCAGLGKMQGETNMIRGILAALALAACATFAALIGRSRVGNVYLAGIDEPTARFLQPAHCSLAPTR